MPFPHSDGLTGHNTTFLPVLPWYAQAPYVSMITMGRWLTALVVRGGYSSASWPMWRSTWTIVPVQSHARHQQ
jgi:hypothetical protein